METTVDLQLLGIFVAVAELASFSKAARRLGVTKATVSRGIARLEETLGVELLHRTTRHVGLSTAGVALYERSAPHLVALRDAVCRLPEREEQPSGRLRVTAPYDFGVSVLVDVVARFSLRYPAVQVEVDVSNRTVDIVAEGFDLAVRATGLQLKDSTLTARRLANIGFHLYAAPAYVARRGSPRAMADADHDWIWLTQASGLLRPPKGLKPRLIATDFFFIRELIRAGAGIGLLPAFVAEDAVRAGELQRVLPGFKLQGGAFTLLYPSSGQVARKVTAFRDLLLETLKAKPLPA